MKLIRLRRAPLFSFNLLPPDSDDRCGLYWHLPEGHPFNAACKYLHDPGFVNHHNGFNVSLSKVNNATISAWWGTAMGQPTLGLKAWYGLQAAAGAIINWTAGPIVWVFGSGRG